MPLSTIFCLLIYASSAAALQSDDVQLFSQADMGATVQHPKSNILINSIPEPTGEPTSQPSGEPTELPTSEPTSAPTTEPTSAPTTEPSGAPSGEPTGTPTSIPSSLPSGLPSGPPTGEPSGIPTGEPSAVPTEQPSGEPTGQPTGEPTSAPSSSPSGQPTEQPSGAPTDQPSSEPTGQPSDEPTGVPTKEPSSEPTNQPTGEPTGQPSGDPSGVPTSLPTAQPSGAPSGVPTGVPTGEPTAQPSDIPTSLPTGEPTGTPTSIPSSLPSGLPSGPPTGEPSGIPTGEPSAVPTEQPSGEPTGQPTGEPTSAPSSSPTGQPTVVPSSVPTSQPTGEPTGQPTEGPTGQPSSDPSGVPTSLPTAQPSGVPSGVPTGVPTGEPTGVPTGEPTVQPSGDPSGVPTSFPTGEPTAQPSAEPTAQPSDIPTSLPTGMPTSAPSSSPTGEPTGQPSGNPTAVPTAEPSGVPTSQPSAIPTSVPTGEPSSVPTGAPSSIPTGVPTDLPTGEPTRQPSGIPTGAPTAVPTEQPSGTPTSLPTGQPSDMPTEQPSSQPTGQPSSEPTGQPTGKPTSVPSRIPTSVPSGVPTEQPSSEPTALPTGEPSRQPTVSPSSEPSGQPSGEPTGQPSVVPSGLPTGVPTGCPTGQPSGPPSAQPSELPTSIPSSVPSAQPSSVPTDSPTGNPSGAPTIRPSGSPSSVPSTRPSATPTMLPSSVPTSSPTFLIPPPELESACFTNDGRHIIVTLSKPSDRAATILAMPSSTFSCDKLFSFPGSSQDSCRWTSTSVVRVTLSAKSNFVYPRNTFILLSGKVKAACPPGVGYCASFEHALSQSVPICSPSNPVAPIMVILSPDPINRCSDIRLRASSSTGRGSAPWATLTWTVAGDFGPAHLSDIESHLAAIVSTSQYPTTASAFVVGNAEFDLKNGTYNFTLCGTNMFGNMGCTTKSVTVSENESLPSVTLDGVSVMYRYQQVIFYGDASVASCSGSVSTQGIRYSYTLFNADTNGVLGLSSKSKNPRNFKLEAFTLDPSMNLKLVLTVTSPSGATNFATHLFSVSRAATRAVISQGSLATVYATSTRIFDGDLSFDLDYPDDKTDLTYSWACEEYSPVPGGPCPITFPSQSAISFDASNFEHSTEYKLTLSVRNILVPSSDSSSVVVVKVQEGLPIPIIDFLNVQAKYNRDRRILIRAVVYTEHQSSDTTWSVYDSEGDELPLSPIALTPRNHQLSAGSTFLSLTTGINTLSEGVSYTFELVATYYPSATSQLALATAQVEIIINESPSGGNFLVSPGSGSALYTIYNFVASGWSDDIEDYPLTYRFAYYSDDETRANLLQDYGTVDGVSTFLGQGSQSLKYRVFGVVWVADRLGSAATDEVHLFVRPLVIRHWRDLIRWFFTLIGNPEQLRVYRDAATASVNAVDCSDAPDCGALNRYNCSATTNTCGSCLPAYPVGITGDDNGQCESGISALSSSRLLSASSDKECPGGCSGNGDCVFTSWNGDMLSACDSLDTSCRAICACDTGYFSADCSRNASMMNATVSIKEATCNASYASLQIEDVTEYVLNSYMLSVYEILKDTTQSSDNGFYFCSKIVIDLIEGYPELAVEDVNLEATIRALSSVLGRGRDIPDEIYGGVMSSISTLSKHRQLTMAPGEEPVELYAQNIRYYTSVVFIGKLTLSNKWGVAQSALEKSVGADASTVAIESLHRYNNSIASTGTTVGVSLWEVLINTGKEASAANSSLIHLETRVVTGNLEEGPASNITTVLYNHELVSYSDDVNAKEHGGSLWCYQSDNDLPYIVYATCEHSFEDAINDDTYFLPVTCSGKTVTPVDYSCPYKFDTPQCTVWNPEESEYFPEDQCAVVSYDELTTTCSCDGSTTVDSRSARISGRMRQSEPTGLQRYEISSVKRVVEVSFDTEVTLWAQPARLQSDNIVIFVMLLVFTIIVFCGTSYLHSRHNDSDPVSKYGADNASDNETYAQVLNVAAHILCHEFGHTEVYARFSRAVLYHSPYFSIFRWKNQYDGADNNELIEKWFVLVGYVLNFMFIHVILAHDIYDDDGYCEDLTSPDRCERRDSMLSPYLSRCEWRYDGNQHCALRSPMGSVVEVFLLVLIVSVIVVPLNYIWSFLVHIIICRAAGDAHGSTKFQITCVDDSPEEENAGMTSKSAKQPIEVSSSEVEVSRQYFKATSSKGGSAKGSSMKATSSGAVVGMDINVDHEVSYVINEARALVLMDDLDDMAMTSPAMHRAYVKKKLRMNDEGEFREESMLNPFRLAAYDRVANRVRRARTAASGVVATMMSIKDREELMNSYLIEIFLLSCLPESLRYFSMKYFFDDSEFYSEWSKEGLVSLLMQRFSFIILAVYTFISLVVIVVLGFKWYSQTTTVTWACLVAISVALDCCLFSPLSVYLRHIAIPATFLEELRRIHRRIRRRYKTIVSHMQEDFSLPGIELVHHFNAGCRAARLINFEAVNDSNANISTRVTNSFLYISDIDLPVLDDAEDPFEGVWSSTARIAVRCVYLLLLPMYHYLSGALVDIALNYITLGGMVLLLLVMYGLASVAAYVPVVVVLGIVVLLIIREKAMYHHQKPRALGHPIDRRVAPLLNRGLEGFASKSTKSIASAKAERTLLNHDELGLVRKALLATDAELEEELLPSLRQPSTFYSNNTKTLVAPIIEEEDDVESESGSRVIVAPAPEPEREPLSLSTSIHPEKEAEQVSLPQTEPEPLPPARSKKKEYVHLSHSDYLILSEAVASYLLTKEEESTKEEGVKFRGVPTPQVVEHVLYKNSALGTELSNMDERKKAGKIVNKIIKNMISKDGTVVVVQPQQDLAAQGSVESLDDRPTLLSNMNHSLVMSTFGSMFETTDQRIALHPSPATRQDLFDSFGGKLPAPVDVGGVTPREEQSSPMKPSTPKTAGKIQVRAQDYKMISATIIDKLRTDEKKWKTENPSNAESFPGVASGGIIDWIVKETGDSNNGDAKKHKKVIHKILARMVHRDRTVDMVGNVDENLSRKELPKSDTLIAEHRGIKSPFVRPVQPESPVKLYEKSSVKSSEEADFSEKKSEKADEISAFNEVAPAAMDGDAGEVIPPVKEAFGEPGSVKSNKLTGSGVLSFKQNLKEKVRDFLETKEISFVKNSADLDEEGVDSCRTIAEWFKEHPEVEINIASHTNCLIGRCDPECYLQSLSQSRVDKVKECFIDCGCTNAMVSKGWGCKHPGYGHVRLIRIYPTDENENDRDPLEAVVSSPSDVPVL